MKTAKKVITISFLTIAIILLIAFGIKTNRSNTNKTTTPVIQHKNALRVDAENYMPVSKHWLLNNPPRPEEEINETTLNTPNFTDTNGNTFNQIYIRKTNLGAAYNWNHITYRNTNTSAYEHVYSYGGNGYTNGWLNTNGAAITFESEPDGNTINILNKIGQPIYNNNAVIIDKHTVDSYGDFTNYQTCIYEVRKSNIVIDNFSIINTDGTVTLYIDQGCQTLRINGTLYNNFNSTISITNKDIYISTTGTPIGVVGYTFTINYFNTLPVIEPEPLPDASQKITEVLDITGLMFEILTMPFSFITQAFNVTLWEGTPYEFNFSNFILSLIAIATLIFIIKLFTSGFSVISNYTASKNNREFKRSQTRLNNAKTQQIKDNKPQIRHTYVHKDKE